MRARRVVVASLSFAGLAVFLLLTRQASAYEHVQNGSFESGAAGWEARYGANVGVAAAEEVAPVDGVATGKVTFTHSRFELRPAINGTLGTGAYELAGYLRAQSAAISATVRVEGAGFEESRALSVGPGGWIPIAVTVNAHAAGDVAITISGEGAPGDVLYLDGVRFTGAPPVTMTPTSVVAPPSATSTGAAALTSPTASPTPERADVISEQLRNASFEEPGVDGAPFAWAKFGGTLSIVSSPVRSGGHAARLESTTASTKWLYQPVLVDPAATYAFDAWVWHDDPGVAAAFLRISWYASADGSGESISSADSSVRLETPAIGFRYLTTGAVTAPPNARSARVRVMLAPLSNAPAAIFVDDASFVPAEPVPPAIATPLVAQVAEAADSEGRSGTSRVAGASRRSGASGSVRPDALFTGASTLVINEVLYDPDFAGEDASGEWVEIYNTGDEDISMAGWTLRDNARASTLPEIIVAGHDFAVVAASDGFFDAYPEFVGIAAWLGGRIGNGLGNDGDRLELVAPDGAVVDAVSWGADASVLAPPVDDVPAGHSIERRVAGADTDTGEDFVDNLMPSPGRAFEAGGANPKRQRSGSTVEILESSGRESLDWLPWALVAFSGAALAGAVAWRGVDALRQRQRAT